MKRHGSVLVFKAGTTPEEAAVALAKIADVLDLPDEITKYVPDGTRVINDGMGDIETKVVRQVRVPHAMTDEIHEFDDDHGGPAWYIP